MPLAQGQVLCDRYRIVKLLGQGGFGAVYRAWDIHLKGTCALKENFDTSPAARSQFEHEASLLSRLRHPNLPRVTDHFMIPEQGQYLVMDYIEGRDLQALLEASNKPLPEAQVVKWLVQICRALEYLHEQKPPVIHRDIKPQNIIMTPDNKAILVDFGVSKLYDRTRKTALAARAVTPGYSPVEQYGGGTTDVCSDIYALGATAYTMLTGQIPPESIERASGTPLHPPSHFSPTMSPALDKTILKAMELHSAQRFQNVAEFRNALKVYSKPDAKLVVASTTSNMQKLRTTKAPPSKKNCAWITWIVILTLLCCCFSATVLYWFYVNGDAILQNLQRITPLVA